MTKVLFVVDEKMLGGVSIVLENILWSLDLNRYKVDIAVLHNRGECFTNLPDGVRLIYGGSFFDSVSYPISQIIKMKDLRLLLNKIRLVFYMKTGLIKKRLIKERNKMGLEHYDTEIAFKDGFTALFTAFGNTKNKIHWLHYEYNLLNPNEKYDRLFKEALPKFNIIVAVSKTVMDCFNKIYHLENKTKVISNLINTKKIKEMAGQLPENHEFSNHFVSVGRLHHQKGYDILLNVISRLAKENKLPNNFKLDIFGDGPMKNELNHQLSELKIEEYVCFKGQTLNPFQYVKNADAFILSSRYEPFGLVIVESMSVGVPVLALSNAATSELIDDKENGLIVENSEQGLYEGLLYLIDNPSFVQNARKKLKDYEYDNSSIVSSIENLL